MKLTEHFTLDELYKSSTATRLGINNIPGADIQAKLKTLAETVLEPIRKKYGKPIVVTSGYRCEKLNTAVKGSSTSDHKYGNAADIRSVSDTPKDNKALFDLIVSMVNSGELKDIKQVIDEYSYDWIHVSYQDGRTTKRNQILHLK